MKRERIESAAIVGTFVLTLAGVGVTIYTQAMGTRATRRQALEITELLLLVEQMSRRTLHTVEAVGEQVGVDMPKTPAEAEVDAHLHR